uniref:Cad n=1 Tax=Arundo donax TaxID=35708 RepID=A0A0A9BDI2_ARUDO
MVAHRLGHLHAHVAHAAEAQDAAAEAGGCEAEVLQRAVHGHAGAQQRRSLLRRQTRGDLHYELLVDDHGGGEPTLRGAAVSVDVVVGPDPLVAVLLDVGLAGAALTAAPDDHPDADDVADAVLGHLGPDLHHLPDHFMPRNHGVFRSTELVLGLVDVSVANPTVQHLHHHIFRICFPDGVGVGGEVAGGVPSGPPHHRPLRSQAPHLYLSWK